MTPTFASLALRGCFLWAKMQVNDRVTYSRQCSTVLCTNRKAQRTNVLPGGSGRLSQVLRASRFVESTVAHRNSGFSQHSGFIDDFRKIPNLSRSLFGFMRPHTIYGTLVLLSCLVLSNLIVSVDKHSIDQSHGRLSRFIAIQHFTLEALAGAFYIILPPNTVCKFS